MKKSSQEPQDSRLMNIRIPGLDTEAGLSLYNGEKDVYIAVLRAYVPNVLKLMDALRHVSEKTLPGYIINVHGLKSISAGIGAENIREAALNLEYIARSGNLSGVLNGNEALLTNAGLLAANIQAWLENLDSLNPKPLLERPDRLLLAQLRKSCEKYDMKGIDDMMDELENSDYKTDASLITWLRETINASDFTSAASRLTAYEEESI